MQYDSWWPSEGTCTTGKPTGLFSTPLFQLVKMADAKNGFPNYPNQNPFIVEGIVLMTKKASACGKFKQHLEI